MNLYPFVSRAALALVSLGLALAPSARAADPAHTISLHSRVIDTRTAEPLEKSTLFAASGTDLSSRYALIKLPGPVTAEQYRALEASVERIYTYLPHFAYLVKLREGDPDALRAEVGASWIGPYRPAYKLAPAVAALSAEETEAESAASTEDGGPARALAGRRIVMIQAFPDADLDSLVARIEALGLGEVVGADRGARFARVRVLAEPRLLAGGRSALAALPEVFWVGLEARRVLLNDTTVWVGQSGLGAGGATPIFDQGIFGEGQIVGVLDTGIDADMCYFRDGSLGLPPTNACNGGTVVDLAQRKVIAVDFLWSSECSGGISGNEWDTQDHGSHVAGTVAGDDLANPLTHDPGDGMAPGAKLVIQDCGFQTDNCADCPGIGCPVVDLNPIFQQAYDQGARIHTNSWGDEENNPEKGRYTAGSQDADEFMWGHKDFLLFFAAGNDGPGTGSIGSPSTAKNVVSVGATLRASSANSMASFSSCGPTDDGRIKPDVTMPGSGIISANADNNVSSNNCNTKSSSGTSMASPGAAGTAALIRQYYTDGWYPSGNPVPVDEFTPSAALVKATLINSAVNMSGTASIPGNCQGWGRVLLDGALHFSGEGRELFAEDDAAGFPLGSSGATRDFAFTVSAGEPFKATLTWTDFPATPLADPTLVNDLDLEVTGPGGTFRGNVFSGGQSTTGGAADRVNTVEQVLLPSPAAGTYTVTVRSFNVPAGPQPFALVVTGALSAPCTPQPIANAGPDQTITSGQSVTIGTPALAGHSYSWSPGGATTAQITVSPTTTTTYTVTATTACGSAQDSVTVTVVGCPGGTTLLHSATFDSGNEGWSNHPSSTCSTGDFVQGTPTQVVNGGVTTQVGGNASGAGSWFTAVNTAAGTNDVDGGTCDTRSPSFTAGAGNLNVQLSYFHGQRDAGGDDGFVIDVLNNGSVVSTLVNFGGVTSNAAWTPFSANVNLASGGDIELRVRATDGPSGGDLVEGGIDSVQVCGDPGGGGCTSDSQCDNDLFCDGAETCNLGTGLCEAGTPPDCGDGVSCTVDSCNEGTDSCDNVPTDSICDDGLFCNGEETCDPVNDCQPGSDPCPGGTCDEQNDECEGDGCPAGSIDFSSFNLTSYADQNVTNGTQVLDGGDTLRVFGNTWVRSTQLFNVTSDTVVEFDFTGTAEGEIHAIGFDNNDVLNDAPRHFHFWGDQNWTGAGRIDYNPKYSGSGTQSFSIPVGQSYTGNMWLVFTGDDDASAASDASFSCVRVIQPPPPSCTVDDDFEAGAPDWFNDAASTCSTGDYVVGNPTQVVNGGVTTQIGGSNSGVNSLFTATNSSAGVNDVDNGNCILGSPTWNVPVASTLSVAYWHGQRDSGGDASGDFFFLEYSTNGGSTWSTLASNGDSTSNASWSTATAAIPAGSNVALRVQCSDGPGSGDLVECGIDDVSICDN